MKPLMPWLFSLLVATHLVQAENWPCFRGPTRQGVSTETGLPLTWDATNGVAWKTALSGEAWSSPIVWGEHVFVTNTLENGTSCRIVAFDRTSGKILWDKEILKQEPFHKQPRNSYSTPTPCTDGERVYAVFGDGSYVAVNFQGDVLWTNRDFRFYGEHGLGSSPVLWEDLIIMARDGSNEGDNKSLGWQVPWDKSFVMALDKNTGKLRWKTGRGMSRIAHVTPNLWKDASGRTQLISGAGDVVQGFDAKSGELLWTSKNAGESAVPSIVIGNGVAFTGSGWGGRESTKAFRLGEEKGNLGESNLLWEQRKGMPHIPSFLYLEPYLFTISEGGIAMCLKADSGEIVWQERVGGTHSASPIAAEGRIYFLADNGETTVIEAGPQFKVLAKNALGEKAQASMAVSQGHFFIRTTESLYCVGPK